MVAGGTGPATPSASSFYDFFFAAVFGPQLQESVSLNNELLNRTLQLQKLEAELKELASLKWGDTHGSDTTQLEQENQQLREQLRSAP